MRIQETYIVDRLLERLVVSESLLQETIKLVLQPQHARDPIDRNLDLWVHRSL